MLLPSWSRCITQSQLQIGLKTCAVIVLPVKIFVLDSLQVTIITCFIIPVWQMSVGFHVSMFSLHLYMILSVHMCVCVCF